MTSHFAETPLPLSNTKCNMQVQSKEMIRQLILKKLIQKFNPPQKEVKKEPMSPIHDPRILGEIQDLRSAWIGLPSPQDQTGSVGVPITIPSPHRHSVGPRHVLS